MIEHFLRSIISKVEFVETDQGTEDLRNEQRLRALVAHQATSVETLIDQRQNFLAAHPPIRARDSESQRQCAGRLSAAINELAQLGKSRFDFRSEGGIVQLGHGPGGLNPSPEVRITVAQVRERVQKKLHAAGPIADQEIEVGQLETNQSL